MRSSARLKNAALRPASHPESDEEDGPEIPRPASLSPRTTLSRSRRCTNGAQVVAGTAWLWSREEYFEAVDVLFVDEAGQMSLANVLALSQAAKNLVLLGDPQQLEQPLKGSHPEGADVSALEHLLAGARTIPPEKGLFLDRLGVCIRKLCEFTSEVFYEGRLRSREGLERQGIEGHRGWVGLASGSLRSDTTVTRTLPPKKSIASPASSTR